MKGEGEKGRGAIERRGKNENMQAGWRTAEKGRGYESEILLIDSNSSSYPIES